jgi:hypothetical protein
MCGKHRNSDALFLKKLIASLGICSIAVSASIVIFSVGAGTLRPAAEG